MPDKKSFSIDLSASLANVQTEAKQPKKSDGEEVERRYNLGMKLLQEKSFDEALRHLKFVANAWTRNPTARANYALGLKMAGRNEEAYPELLAAGIINKHSAATVVQVCCALQDLGYTAEAAGLLPDDSPTLPFIDRLRCIDVLRKAADAGAIAARVVQVIETGPKKPSEWHNLALRANEARKLTAAITAAENYFDAIEPTEEDYALMIVLHLQDQNLDRVEQLLDEAFSKEIRSSRLLAQAARTASFRGERDVAVAYLEEAIKADPAAGEAWVPLSQHVPKEKIPPHIAKLVEVIAQPGKDRYMTLQYALAEMYRRSDQREEAIQAFAHANRLQEASMVQEGKVYVIKESSRRAKNIRRVFTHTVFDEERSSPGKENTPIFIVGMPRSGTSLLERMLGILDGVEMGGESFALGHLASRYFSDLAQYARAFPHRLTPEEWGAFADEYWSLSRARAAFVTDKMPTNYFYIGLAMKMFPHAPILHLKRDPMDVCWSIYRRRFQNAYGYACNFEKLAHAYLMSDQMMDFWKERAPGRIMTVQYETLAADPENTSKKIAEFCGLEWHEKCLATHEVDAATFTFSDTQVRKPISTKGIGQWREYEAYLGPLKQALEERGYEIDAG